jgi:hypothetical protein
MSIADIKVTKHRDGSVTLKGHRWDISTLVNSAERGAFAFIETARRQGDQAWLESVEEQQRQLEELHTNVKGG